MKCPNCGHEAMAGLSFCPNCFTTLGVTQTLHEAGGPPTALWLRHVRGGGRRDNIVRALVTGLNLAPGQAEQIVSEAERDENGALVATGIPQATARAASRLAAAAGAVLEVLDDQDLKDKQQVKAHHQRVHAQRERDEAKRKKAASGSSCCCALALVPSAVLFAGVVVVIVLRVAG